MDACRAARTFLVIVLGVALSSAKDFWDEPYEKWNRNQVNTMINDSPWARDQTLSSLTGVRGSGIEGQKEIFNKFTIRFFSARPIREAYVRMMQLLNNYDEMPHEQRQEFVTRFSRPLNLDVSERVIVALDFASNLPQTNRDMKNFLDLARTETLKQSVYLISQRLGRVELREYFPPSPDGTGAKFIFPRLVKGQAVIAPGDKEVRFEFYVPPIDSKLFVTFKVAKMFYKGELSY